MMPTLAYVLWEDASFQRGECADEDLVPRVVIESAGLFVREDDESVSVALDHYQTDGLWRYIEHIPKALILQFKKVDITP
jgi:hypothetical protein